MRRFAALALIASLATPALAQEDARPPPRRAAGVELFHSSDSDDTTVVRAAIDFDLRNEGPDHSLGVRFERAWYDPGGTGASARDRVFLRAANTIGGWKWRAQVGTDGDTVIGAVSIHDEARFRKEFFVERDIVESREGLARGIYSTFVGAAIDLPADERNIFTAVAGLQAFTGDNTRLHLRGSYIHVVQPEWGLSAQLRGRYFRSSDPGEFDYYSPKWYAEIVPVAQLRRFVGGWELVGAGGIGVQRDAGSKWRQSNYLHARVRSPATSGWIVRGDFTYSNTPSLTAAAGSGYTYVQGSVAIARRF